LSDAVYKGTSKAIYMEDLPIAGKTGTAKSSYNTSGKSVYTASFAGYFPADDPKYSCIVVVNDPDTKIGFYGAQIAAPAFKEIAEKIYTRTPQSDTLQTYSHRNDRVEESFDKYYGLAKEEKIMPEVVGLPAMDAVP